MFAFVYSTSSDAAVSDGGARVVNKPRGKPHSLVGQLHVRILASVGVYALVPPVDVDAHLRLGALVLPRLTLIHVWIEGEEEEQSA